MKRAFVILGCLCLVVLGGYLAFSRWAIRHETLALFDVARNRPVTVELAVLWDSEVRADAGLITPAVAIVSHGNTVRNTEYSFLTNVLAARGFLVASIQHDLPTDPPMVTQPGTLFVGRLPTYERGALNILFAVSELRKIQPNANYERLTMVGHSNGGDISMFFAQEYPQLVRMIVTLDNLRMPCLLSGSAKILQFRSNDWKPDIGVVPSDEQSRRSGHHHSNGISSCRDERPGPRSLQEQHSRRARQIPERQRREPVWRSITGAVAAQPFVTKI